MRILFRIIQVLTIVLGVMTGLVKLTFMPEEMALFRGAHIPDAATVVFGVVQILAALGLITARTRRPAGIALAATFVAATGVLLVNGLLVFGVVSVSFIAMALFVALYTPTGASTATPPQHAHPAPSSPEYGAHGP